MKKMLITDDNVNIDSYPIKNENVTGITNITTGDLHSNAIKLIFFLLHERIGKLSKYAYQQLVKIYRTPVNELTTENLNQFKVIITGMQIVDNSVLIRLIGDELCDRGSNDYFILKILEKLKKESVPLEILVSNHAIGFIEAYELRPSFFYEPFGYDFASSIYNLQTLIDKQLITREEILNLINTVYKPCLKVISYSTDIELQTFTIYSHAPIDLTDIKSMALELNVHYSEATIEDFSHTIENINVQFKKRVVGNEVHTLYDPLKMGHNFQDKTNEKHPLAIITWNRDTEHLNRPSELNSFELVFVHGHDIDSLTSHQVINLDNYLGKSPDSHTGQYDILVSGEVSYEESVIKSNTAKNKRSPNSTVASIFTFLSTKTNEDNLNKKDPSETLTLIKPELNNDHTADEYTIEPLNEQLFELDFMFSGTPESDFTEWCKVKSTENEQPTTPKQVVDSSTQTIETNSLASLSEPSTKQPATSLQLVLYEPNKEKKSITEQKYAEELFLLKLKLLREKKENLLLRGETQAYETTCKLHKELKTTSLAYFNGGHTASDFGLFKKQSKMLLDNAKPDAQKHRGFAASIKRWLGFFKTDTFKKIIDLEKSLDKLAP